MNYVKLGVQTEEGLAHPLHREYAKFPVGRAGLSCSLLQFKLRVRSWAPHQLNICSLSSSGPQSPNYHGSKKYDYTAIFCLYLPGSQMFHVSETSFNHNFLAWRFQYNVRIIKTQLGPEIDGALTSCGTCFHESKW